MTRRSVAALLMSSLGVSSAWARDCHTSREFQLKQSQTLAGVLVDPVEATLPGISLELLSGHKVVRQLRTDNEGRYSFGDLPAGKYRIRIEKRGFCAPKIKCTDKSCTIKPKLSLDSPGTVVE